MADAPCILVSATGNYVEHMKMMNSDQAALQARMVGFQVTSCESVVGEIGILALATGNYDIITMEHIKICTTPLWATAVTSTTRSTWPGLSSV